MAGSAAPVAPRCARQLSLSAADGWQTLPSISRLLEEAGVYTINTLPLRSCLLLDDIDGLKDGLVLSHMLCAASRTPAQLAEAERLLEVKNIEERLAGILQGLCDVVSEPSLAGLRAPATLRALQCGDRDVLMAVARVLCVAVSERSGLSVVDEATAVAAGADDAMGAARSPSQTRGSKPPQAARGDASRASAQEDEQPCQGSEGVTSKRLRGDSTSPPTQWTTAASASDEVGVAVGSTDALRRSPPSRLPSRNPHPSTSPRPSQPLPTPLPTVSTAPSPPPPMSQPVAPPRHSIGCGERCTVDGAPPPTSQQQQQQPRPRNISGMDAPRASSTRVGGARASSAARRAPSGQAACRQPRAAAHAVQRLDAICPPQRLRRSTSAAATSALARRAQALPSLMPTVEFWLLGADGNPGGAALHRPIATAAAGRPRASSSSRVEALRTTPAALLAAAVGDPRLMLPAANRPLAGSTTGADGASHWADRAALAAHVSKEEREAIVSWIRAVALPCAMPEGEIERTARGLVCRGTAEPDGGGGGTLSAAAAGVAAAADRTMPPGVQPRSLATPFDGIRHPDDVPAALASGALLAVLVERLLGQWTATERSHRRADRISGLEPTPRTHAAIVGNFDAALGALRQGPPLARGERRWLASTLARGDVDALWALLSALYHRFACKTIARGGLRMRSMPRDARAVPRRVHLKHGAPHGRTSPTRQAAGLPASASAGRAACSISGPCAASSASSRATPREGVLVTEEEAARAEVLLTILMQPSVQGRIATAAAATSLDSTVSTAALELDALIGRSGDALSAHLVAHCASLPSAAREMRILRETLEATCPSLLRRLQRAARARLDAQTRGSDAPALQAAMHVAALLQVERPPLDTAALRLSVLTAVVPPAPLSDQILSHAPTPPTLRGRAPTAAAAPHTLCSWDAPSTDALCASAEAAPQRPRARARASPEPEDWETPAGRARLHAWLRASCGVDVAERSPFTLGRERGALEDDCGGRDCATHCSGGACALGVGLAACATVHPIDDPICNGLLLCQIAQRLPRVVPILRRPPFLRPRLPAQSQANLIAALHALSEAAAGAALVLPHSELGVLARALPAVVTGAQLPVWRLIAWLCALNPTPPPPRRRARPRPSQCAAAERIHRRVRRPAQPPVTLGQVSNARPAAGAPPVLGHAVESTVIRWLHAAQLVRLSATEGHAYDGHVARTPDQSPERSRRPAGSPPGTPRAELHSPLRSPARSPLRSPARMHEPTRSHPSAHSRTAAPSSPGRPSSPPLRLPTLDELIPAIASGELLCDVAAYVSGSPLHGVFRPPRTCATALSNIRRATQRLREAATGGTALPSQEEIGNEAALLHADRAAAMRWLLAARRLSPSRSMGGGTEGLGAGANAEKAVAMDAFEERAKRVVTLPSHAATDAEEAPSVCGVGRTAAGKEDHDRDRDRADLTNTEHGHAAAVWPADESGASVRSTASASMGTTADSDATHQAANGVVTVKAMPAAPHQGSACSHRLAAISESSQAESGEDACGGDTLEAGGQHKTGGECSAATKRARLSAWLHANGIDARAADLCLRETVLLGWQDGLALIDLVEKLEARSLVGIERAPRAAAQYRRNVEKALEALRLKKGMPITHLYAAAQIARGDAAAVLPLLADMKAAYLKRTSRTRPLQPPGQDVTRAAGSWFVSR